MKLATLVQLIANLMELLYYREEEIQRNRTY